HRYGGWEHTLHALAAAPGDETVRLAVLLHDIGKPGCKTTDEAGIDHFYGHPAAGAALADIMLRALKFDNATRERVVTLVERHDTPIHPTDKSIRRWLGRLGEETFFQLLEVKRCDNMGQDYTLVQERLTAIEELNAAARAIIAQGQCFSLKDLAVDGRDVMAAGVPAGPQVGQALAHLLDQVIIGAVPNDRLALLRCLEKSLSHPQ
ncbi:MAG: HD domain-containing protein, partial [Muribaculaceae bacterium]|nr:HD domain-containing protein [Muribaculaceae bacterium]